MSPHLVNEQWFILPNNEADLQEITLKGPGRLTLKNNFEPLLSL
jgi:hypothetical protein